MMQNSEQQLDTIPERIEQALTGLKTNLQSKDVEQSMEVNYPHLENVNNYVVVLGSGEADGGQRATLAFSAACTAIAMDLNAHVFLVGDGAYWAYEGHCDDVEKTGFPPLKELFETFIELGGKTFVCSACDTVCATQDDNQGKPLVRYSSIKPRGMAYILKHTIGGSSITF